MCGIAGIFNRTGADVDPDTLLRMADAIGHRGPDDRGGVFLCSTRDFPPVESSDLSSSTDGRDVGLASRRLAILDLSAAGHQPMTLRHLTLAYNGEIYNYLELAKELRARGHSFQSTSDTEVLLHSYDEWGTACLERLNGIFSFAIWDGRRKVLFCARDRLGVKPFYYSIERGDFLFCSEIKGILAALPQTPTLNEPLAFDHLTNGRLNHVEGTFFQEITVLPAASWMEVDHRGVRVERYWNVSAVAEGSSDIDANVERFSELFRDSIRLQMRSDVPIACCLSGGLDSSAVVSVAAPLSGYPMRAYTARFRDRTMDEWEYAQSVHRIKPVEPVAVYAEPQEFWERLPQLVWDQEEPFGGPGVFAQWKLMQQIHRDGIKVVLDGQGGDELLCGYAKYFYFSVREMVRKGELTSAAVAVMDAVLRRGNHLFNIMGARRYLPSKLWLDRYRVRLLQPDFAAKHADRVIGHPVCDVRAQQNLDIERFSIPVLLRYEDKNSMAHSVESRVPFLDHRLVEFALGLPTAHKIRRSQSKYVLRQALATDMPSEVLGRRGKLGFGGTYRSWLDELAPQIGDWLSQSHRSVDRFVRPETLRQLFSKRDPILFKSLIFDRWLDRFSLS